MVKEEIITLIARETKLPQREVSNVIESLLKNITLSLKQGKKVQFAGFGVFEPRERKARTGRNPHTNTPVYIPKRIMPTFKPGIKLKSEVCQKI